MDRSGSGSVMEQDAAGGSADAARQRLRKESAAAPCRTPQKSGVSGAIATPHKATGVPRMSSTVAQTAGGLSSSPTQSVAGKRQRVCQPSRSLLESFSAAPSDDYDSPIKGVSFCGISLEGVCQPDDGVVQQRVQQQLQRQQQRQQEPMASSAGGAHVVSSPPRGGANGGQFSFATPCRVPRGAGTPAGGEHQHQHGTPHPREEAASGKRPPRPPHHLTPGSVRGSAVKASSAASPAAKKNLGFWLDAHVSSSPARPHNGGGAGGAGGGGGGIAGGRTLVFSPPPAALSRGAAAAPVADGAAVPQPQAQEQQAQQLQQTAASSVAARLPLQPRHVPKRASYDTAVKVCGCPVRSQLHVDVWIASGVIWGEGGVRV